MARTPVLPNPVQSPTGSTSYYASGGSGVVVSAGEMAPSSLSGAWYEEEQMMSLYYSRCPVGKINPGGIAVSLSSCAATYTVTGSKLLTAITASYQVRKTYGVYPTQTWQQPQKFTILATSADYQDNTYGDLTASTLGPGGNIVTSQPWRLRRPWAATDVETYEAMEGYTFCKRVVGCLGTQQAGWFGGQSEYMNDFEAAIISPWSIGTFVAPQWLCASSGAFPWSSYFSHDCFYTLGGGYSTTQEAWQQVIGYINGCGERVSTSKVWGETHEQQNTAPNVGFAEYDILRHSFV